MPYTQTLVASLFLFVSILISLGFNEGVYSSVDLNTRLNAATYSNVSLAPKDCRYGMNNWILGNFTENDDIAREFLYGGFSARGSAISSIVLVLGALILSLVCNDLDFDMSAARYINGSWIHEGNTKTFVSGVLYQLMMTGSVLSVMVMSACILVSFSKQGYVPSLGIDFGVEDNEPRKVPELCSAVDDNVVHRSDSLKVSLFFSLGSLLSIYFVDYAIRYDKKASV